MAIFNNSGLLTLEAGDTDFGSLGAETHSGYRLDTGRRTAMVSGIIVPNLANLSVDFSYTRIVKHIFDGDTAGRLFLTDEEDGSQYTNVDSSRPTIDLTGAVICDQTHNDGGSVFLQEAPAFIYDNTLYHIYLDSTSTQALIPLQGAGEVRSGGVTFQVNSTEINANLQIALGSRGGSFEGPVTVINESQSAIGSFTAQLFPVFGLSSFTTSVNATVTGINTGTTGLAIDLPLGSAGLCAIPMVNFVPTIDRTLNLQHVRNTNVYMVGRDTSNPGTVDGFVNQTYQEGNDSGSVGNCVKGIGFLYGRRATDPVGNPVENTIYQIEGTASGQSESFYSDAILAQAVTDSDGLFDCGSLGSSGSTSITDLNNFVGTSIVCPHPHYITYTSSESYATTGDNSTTSRTAYTIDATQATADSFGVTLPSKWIPTMHRLSSSTQRSIVGRANQDDMFEIDEYVIKRRSAGYLPFQSTATNPFSGLTDPVDNTSDAMEIDVLYDTTASDFTIAPTTSGSTTNVTVSGGGLGTGQEINIVFTESSGTLTTAAVEIVTNDTDLEFELIYKAMIDVLCLPFVTTASGFNPISNSTTISPGRINYEYPMDQSGNVDSKWSFSKDGTGIVNAGSIFSSITVTDTSQDLSALSDGSLSVIDQNSPSSGDVVFTIPSAFVDNGCFISVDLIDSSNDWVSYETSGRLTDSIIPSDGTNSTLERLLNDDVQIVVTVPNTATGAQLTIAEKTIEDVLQSAQMNSNNAVFVDAPTLTANPFWDDNVSFPTGEDAYSYVRLYTTDPSVVDNSIVADDPAGTTMVVEFYSDSQLSGRSLNISRWNNVVLSIRGDNTSTTGQALGAKYARLMGRLNTTDLVFANTLGGTLTDAIDVALTARTHITEGAYTFNGTVGAATENVTFAITEFQSVANYDIIQNRAYLASREAIEDEDVATTTELTATENALTDEIDVSKDELIANIDIINP